MAEATAAGASAGQSATTTQTATATAAAPATTSTDWTQGFNDDQKGYIQKKGFKDASALADSYINLEKLHGVGPDRLLKLPDTMDSPEGQAIWERLGKPKEAKAYNLKVPEQGGDPKLAEWAADIFHKGNLTTKQAETVMQAWNERQAQVAAQSTENQKAAGQMALTDLKTEWGAAFDKNMGLVDQAGKILGWDVAKLNALKAAVGPKDAMKMMLDVANSTAEDKFVSGRPAADGTVTPEQARSELQELYRDANWVKAYTSGDYEAKKRMQHLQEMANPGTRSLS